MDNNFIAYLAGVIDSDGSISICRHHTTRKNPTFTATVQLTWSNNPKCRAVLEKIKANYGGNISICDKTNIHNFKSYQINICKYNITSQLAKKFLYDILPFLHLKRKQCRLALRLINSTQYGKYGHGRPKPKKLIDFHESLYLKNKILNTKNGASNGSD